MSHRVLTPPAVYSIDALESEGFSRRTIRYYISIGVLPHAHGRGRSAYYTTVHLDILQAIRNARDSRRTLGDVKEHALAVYGSCFKPQVS